MADLTHETEHSGQVRLAHGRNCIVIIHDGVHIVLTSDEARRLAAAITQQADASDLLEDQ